MDGLGADDRVGCGFDGAEAIVALVEAGVEETPWAVGERWGLALGSVGLDVTTECVLHDSSPWFEGGTPYVAFSRVLCLQEVSEISSAKFVQSLGLWLNSCQQTTYVLLDGLNAKAQAVAGAFSIYIFSIPD
jgi:hypothetical protein